MRSGYRYRINKALRNLDNLIVKKIENDGFDDQFYSLYVNVFNKSEYKLEKLTKEFFVNFGDIKAFYDESIQEDSFRHIIIIRKTSSIFYSVALIIHTKRLQIFII